MLPENNYGFGESIERQENIQGKKDTSQLMEVLFKKEIEYTIGYKKMKQVIEKCYAKQGKKVKAEITYDMDNDDGIYHGSNTFITITEKNINSMSGIIIKNESFYRGFKKDNISSSKKGVKRINRFNKRCYYKE